jgi:hypothetical protein
VVKLARTAAPQAERRRSSSSATRATPPRPTSVLLQHNGLHLDIQIDRSTPIGQRPGRRGRPGAGSGLSTILDLEDSVAAVDAEDKVLGYSNWLGILQGTLTEQVDQGRQDLHARPEPRPRLHRRRRQGPGALHGRSLMFVRNVGHLMTNPAILYTGADGAHREIPEGIMDAVVTTTIALHDLQGPRQSQRRHPQLAQGQRLHRQAQDARPGRGGFCQRAVRPRRAAAGPARQHRQAGHHGRRAPHQRQPQGLHRRRIQPRGLHQHRLPGPHRRRDAHRHAGRPHDAQGRHEDQRLDPGLREEQRAGGPGLRPARQGADRQGHVGHARPDGHAGAEDRPPQGRCQHRLGAQPHRRHAARAALPPGAGERRAEGAGKDGDAERATC